MINILVNLQLFPSKGMTLPLVSYGGSSTIAVCMTVGLLLAITRRNPYLKPETPGLMALLGQRDDAACVVIRARAPAGTISRSEEHTSELQSLMRIQYAVFCL